MKSNSRPDALPGLHHWRWWWRARHVANSQEAAKLEAFLRRGNKSHRDRDRQLQAAS